MAALSRCIKDVYEKKVQAKIGLSSGPGSATVVVRCCGRSILSSDGAAQAGPFERAAYYRELAAGEAAWLSSIQLENGAIPFRGETHGEASITPYFSDIAAWASWKEGSTGR